MRTRLALLGFIGVSAALLAAFAPGSMAAKKNACPSGGTPAAGSKVKGGLEVDGICILDNVTVNGGVVVDATGHLQVFDHSTVNGGITVKPAGELDVNATTPEVGAPTGTTATINGGIRIDGGTVGGADVDIWTARINGGLDLTGNFPLGFPSPGIHNRPIICGNTIHGSVRFHDVNTYGSLWFGDPEAVFFGFPCTGNTVDGSLTISNSKSTVARQEYESNTIKGSVSISNSTLELNGNTIGGSLSCSNGTVILAGEAGDPVGNTVGGSNTC
jgi:hypothetical protein